MFCFDALSYLYPTIQWQDYFDMKQAEKTVNKNVPMQIRIPDNKKKTIKADAAMRGISVSRLLLDAYDSYKVKEKH